MRKAEIIGIMLESKAKRSRRIIAARGVDFKRDRGKSKKTSAKGSRPETTPMNVPAAAARRKAEITLRNVKKTLFQKTDSENSFRQDSAVLRGEGSISEEFTVKLKIPQSKTKISIEKILTESLFNYSSCKKSIVRKFSANCFRRKIIEKRKKRENFGFSFGGTFPCKGAVGNGF